MLDETDPPVSLASSGFVYAKPAGAAPDWYAAGEAVSEPAAFAAQLEGVGRASADEAGNLLVPWSSVYWALRQDDLNPSIEALPVPPLDPAVVPALVSRGTISDQRFNVSLASWHRIGRGPLSDSLDLVGPVHRDFMLSEEVHALLEAVKRFQTRAPEERSPEHNRFAWAEIRDLALAGNAILDKFLRETIVLRPRTLRLKLEREQFGDDVAVKITPTFQRAPDGWERTFERARQVTNIYKVVSAEGYHEVVAEDDVAEVLGEIKRSRGLVVGDRARRLLENPFAFFENAEAVFDEAAIEEELARIRQGTWSFRPKLDLAPDGTVNAAGIEAEPIGDEAPSGTEVRLFSAPDALAVFVERLDRDLRRGHPFVSWRGLDLELGRDAEIHLATLKEVLAGWRQGQSAVIDEEVETATPDAGAFVISAAMVLDLERYTDRVEAIGIETRYGIISIPLNRRGAWLPEDEELKLFLEDSEEPLSFNKDELADLVKATDHALDSGARSVGIAGGRSMPTERAQDFLDALPKALIDEIRGISAEGDARETTERPAPQPRTGLLIRPNIDAEDYVTKRASSLRPDDGAAPLVPSSLRPGVQLKEHQRHGLLWMQHLFTQSPGLCRGALLADDMGLGKTLQTLALIARAREDDPDLAPALVVAPVTLLDNWAQEVDRFFLPGTLPIRTLYGSGLQEHRVAKHEIDARLKAEGLRRFLRPGWSEGAAVVLTTYETLRDYEFSFGDVAWSIVVCDEAQRIKNPNALISRAAKKLNARFCVAATGTPVENNLTDLWSLFDFIQPGLLEPLNRFNRNYRRPIEAKTDTERQQLDHLRALIEPQLLRRVKRDVARDLPEKRFDSAARKLRMTDRQRILYQTTLSAQTIAGDTRSRGTDLLELISKLRRICTDPRSTRELAAPLPPLAEYRATAPKLDWLILTLEAVQARGEKAIIFLDRKDIQRLLQAYIREHFGFAPEIINGETPTSGDKDSRQKRVDRFQSKPGFGVLILSPIAAGVGLNIQEANHVIHYMRHWNPAKEDQATDRAYRIGQERDVTVYTPIVVGDGFVSFDERLDELLGKKRAIASDVLNGSDDAGVAEFADLVPGN